MTTDSLWQVRIFFVFDQPWEIDLRSDTDPNGQHSNLRGMFKQHTVLLLIRATHWVVTDRVSGPLSTLSEGTVGRGGGKQY